MKIKEFLTKIIPERFNPGFKITEGQNIRKLKKDIIEKSTETIPE
jgi:hypothetical protein